MNSEKLSVIFFGSNHLSVACLDKLLIDERFEELFQELQVLKPDYFVVVAYGAILPQRYLDIPRQLSINVHGSILPAYRGASPLQTAILDQAAITGVTIMQMSLGMDE